MKIAMVSTATNITSALLILMLFGFDQRPLTADEIDFNRDVKPILSNRCYLCHGPDESSREADLRLDSFEAVTQYAIDPGNSADSEVYIRIIDSDEDARMPPAKHGPPLTGEETRIIKRWIDSGAKYEKHWSYQTPDRKEPDKRSKEHFVKDNWNENDIDGFVLSAMQRNQLAPAKPADHYSMIRRLALDLTGLPPSIKEADMLLLNDNQQSYEQLVDYFLEQPSFGERWAAMWLDHARYADSMGYAEDRNRTIWAYRDYVVRAFNDNMPFDQFTIEQLAGDLLDDPTDDQLIATAFHRNTLTNTEGGTIDEEFRSAAVVDRTNTTMAVWMGTTMACAQCHTHKYDPITQDEYFQFYAFFNSTADNDQPNDSPTLKIFSDDQKSKRQKLQANIDQLVDQIDNWDRLTIGEKKSAMSKDWDRWLASNETIDSNSVAGRFVRIDLPKQNAILSLAEVEIFAGDKNVAATGKARQSSTAYNGPAQKAIDGNTDGDMTKNQSVTHTDTENNPWWEVKFKVDVQIDKIVVWNRTQNLHSRMDGFEVSILDNDRNVMWTTATAKAKPTPETFAGIRRFPAPIFAALSNKDRSAEDQLLLHQHFLENHNPAKSASIHLADLKRQLDSMRPHTTVPIQRELKKPRETFVHIRGSYLNPGNKVDRETPTAFHPFGNKPKDRLELARWIVHRDNPLTARVIVNRIWQQLFGIGIVTTSEEFGAQGELPTHPQLLDYLACEFMDSGWDIKAIIKLIVTSATYRQESIATAHKMQIDPNNRWLSRGPRFRLTAEMIRDQALAVSGLLSSKMYGPPVQPPQPKSGLKIAFRSESTDWKDSIGEDRYRRAIYTRWRRSSPYPSMTTFDISNREVCELRRLRTNTPLQALVTLNDPVYVEAAQALARLIYDPSKSPKQMATEAFRRALVRPAKPTETKLLVQLYRESLAHFENDTASAEKLAVDPLNPVDQDTNLTQLAAWTTVANAILNLDEMFMKR